MPTEHPSDLKFEIGHVLFIDIVSYSKLLINEQSEQIQQLTKIVRGTEQFRLAEAEGKLLRLPTGDGGALVFRTSPEAPVLCALEIAKDLKKHPELQVRLGIHSGPVNEVTDLNAQANIAGAGINIAQRVMDCGDAGHILLSRHVADDLKHYARWRPYLHEIGECKVKHGETVSLVNFYTEELGNPQRPQNIKGTRQMRSGTLVSKFIAGAIALAIITVGLPMFLFLGPKWLKRPSPAAGTAVTVAPAKSVAVLPFVNMSADKNDEYLSDGVSEELIAALSKINGLQVKARTSSFAFKGKNEDIQKIGELLHVTHLLEGSVARAGNKLRITAQLIQASDGNHLWSDTYDREMQDIFAVRSEVAKQVVQTLQVKLGVEATRALAKNPTENPEAHRLYLLGRYHFAKATATSWIDARQYFEQAIQLDPAYALAYCGLADSYCDIVVENVRPKEAWAQGRKAAEKALELDPDLPDAHLSLGSALANAFDWRGGETEIKRALELNPNLALGYEEHAWILSCLGRFDEAIASQNKAIELDPLSPFMNWHLCGWLYLARRYDETIAQAKRTLELDPTLGVAHSFLGWCFLWKADSAGAIAEFQRAKALDPQPEYDANLGYAYAISGDRVKAGQILHELEDAVKRRYVGPGTFMTIYLGLGEKERALNWLEKCYDEQDMACWFLKVDRIYDTVRNEPRFQAILKKAGLE